MVPVDDYLFELDQVNDVTEGRAWDGGPRGRDIDDTLQLPISEGSRFNAGSPYPPTAIRSVGGPGPNQVAPFKHFYATPDPNQTTIYLEWAAIGLTPAVWRHSPKQHDFHSVNVEGLAYRSGIEMIVGLRSPLSVDRRTGNALYLRATSVANFLPAGAWPAGSQMQGINKELVGEKFSLYSWTGNSGDSPVKLIDDLRPYTIRPEGVDLIQVAGQWRILFVEDRYSATGYATRNAVHWPVGILGGSL